MKKDGANSSSGLLQALRDVLLFFWVVLVCVFALLLSVPGGGKTEAMFPGALVSIKNAVVPLLTDPEALRRALPL